MATVTTKRGPGRPRKSDEAKAAERAAILASVRRSLAERGPDVSLDELASLAGVSKPAIYAHFTDKAGLAEALALGVATEVEARTVQRIAGRGVEGPTELLRAGIDAFTRFMADETSLYRFMVRSIKTEESDVFDNALLPAFQSRTAALIGLVYPDMDADAREIASYALLGQVFSACEGWLQHRRFSRRKLVDSLVALFAEGVVALRRR